MNIIFLGAPGSGKGTQATMLANELKIPPISTGEILRKEITNQSDIGKLAGSYVTSGKLVPDDVVIEIIKNRISESDCQNGFILDGFPRNISQAEALDTMLLLLNKKIDRVFNFEVDKEVLVQRISGRFSCKDCNALYNKYFKLPKEKGVCDICKSVQFESRSDDNEETVKNRLVVYQESTFGLIELYKKKSLLVSIDAIKKPTLVFELLKSYL